MFCEEVSESGRVMLRKIKEVCILSLIVAAIVFIGTKETVCASGSGMQARVQESTMITYSGFVSGSWGETKYNGERIGTVGISTKLEALKISTINISGYSGEVLYRSHVQTYGWEDGWKRENQISGTVNKGKRLEAIQIKLTGELEKHYDVYYRTHVETFGWLDWAKNGESAGTEGYSKRVEALEIVLVTKGGLAPGETGLAFVNKSKGLVYGTHVQTYGWQQNVTNGQYAGTTGLSKRLESIQIKLQDQPCQGGIEYKSHIQTYGWETDWKKNGQKSGTEGLSKRLEAICIRLTGEMAEKYDVYYRVHVQRLGWLGWVKNGEAAGTAGFSYRMESIQILLLPKNARTFNSAVGFVSKDASASTVSWNIAEVTANVADDELLVNNPIALSVKGTNTYGENVACNYTWKNTTTGESGSIGTAGFGEVLWWTPSVSGDYVLKVTASDASQHSQTKEIQLFVKHGAIKREDAFFTAHKGLAGFAPANSIPAFQLAGQYGFDSIEADISETKDGVFVISHDINLQNICGVNVNICDLTYAELQDYERYHIIQGINAGRYTNEELKIPTLEEYLDICIQYNCIPQLDTKNLNSVDSVLRIYDILVQKGIEDQTIVTSFNNLYLQKLRNLNANIVLTYGVNSTQYLEYDWLQTYNIGISASYSKLLSTDLSVYAEKNIAVNAYTVNNTTIAGALLDKGVDSITTEYVLWQ